MSRTVLASRWRPTSYAPGCSASMGSNRLAPPAGSVMTARTSRSLGVCVGCCGSTPPDVDPVRADPDPEARGTVGPRRGQREERIRAPRTLRAGAGLRYPWGEPGPKRLHRGASDHLLADLQLPDQCLRVGGRAVLDVAVGRASDPPAGRDSPVLVGSDGEARGVRTETG